ncbi:uncharacterized protein LOC131346706 [Hemibagrus wyckioides]|uniref:uncharacterized protein LOC131346706 n=1 Tax=Hemibagrus wyckioides TaxID=337641 RepID=UPI00266C8704|nr:uncharacterized protein LOC131346706 [Hemibagrus wyckioides]
MDLTKCVITDGPNQTDLRLFANYLMNVTGEVVSTFLKKMDSNVSFSVSVQNLEVEVLKCQLTTCTEISPLITSYVSLNIDFSWTSESNTALAFMSYTNMADIFKPSFFDTNIVSTKTLMSTVVQLSNPQITQSMDLPTNFTLEHIRELDPKAILTCMDWEPSGWPMCYIIETNNTHTMCSCYYMTSAIRIALISETDPCMDISTEDCEENFLIRMFYYIYYIKQLPQETVENYLITTTNLTERVKMRWVPYYYYYYGAILLYVNELIVTTLEKETDTYNFISISLQTLEVKVLMLGPFANLNKTPTVTTSHASLDIDLIKISKNYNVSVTLLSYTNIADILELSFYNTFTNLNKNIVSPVVTILCQGTDFDLTKPMNVTLNHIKGIKTEGILLCANTDWYMWETSLCSITHTNSTHTVCSCSSCPGTLALFLMTIPCMDNFIAQCAKNFLDDIPNYATEDMTLELVESYINIISTLMTRVKNVTSEENDLISFGNSVLEVSEKVMQKLIQMNATVSFQNLEVQVFSVVPNVDLSRTLTLITSHASLDIKLSGIYLSENYQGSVTFLSFNKISDILKPTFFKTIINTKKTLISTVVSVLLSQDTQLTTAINVTFQHTTTTALKSGFSLSCVYWKDTEWIEGGCDIIQTNSSHTVCSCNQLDTFALIMETDPCIVRHQYITQLHLIGTVSIRNNVFSSFLHIVICFLHSFMSS